MSLRTQRIILVSLLLLIAGLSFCGCCTVYHSYAQAEENGLEIYWNHAGPNRDFLVAFILVLAAVAAANRLARIAFLCVVIAMGPYLLWAINPGDWVGDPHFLAVFSQHLTFFYRHFPGSRWWHALILPLLFLSLIWAGIPAWEELAMARGTASPDLRGDIRRLGITLTTTCVWAVAVVAFFVRYPITGLAPWPIRLAANPSFEERMLAKVPVWTWYRTSLVNEISPKYMLPGEFVKISPDGKKAVYISRELALTGKHFIVEGGVRGPSVDWIDNITFSPDGSSMGYLVRAGSRCFAVINGKKGPDFDEVKELTFSQDGRRSAYVGELNKEYYPVVDGQIGPGFGVISGLHFRCDGRCVYEAGRDDYAFELVEGQATADFPFEGFGIYYSDDCLSSAGMTHAGGKRIIVFAGKEGPKFDSLEGVPQFSPDGTMVAYGVKMDGAPRVVVQGKKIEILKGASPKFTPDGRLAYIQGAPSHYSLVIDGKAGEEFSTGIMPPVFSRDGRVFAYEVGGSLNSLVVFGTKKGPAFDRIIDLKISNDGRTVAYSVFDKGRAFVMVNDHKGAEYDWVGAPVISPDGTDVAYRAWQGYREFIVLNDREGEKFNWVSDPVFSPDGRKLAFAASKGREILWKVVNVP